MLKAYKYRICPNNQQIEFLNNCFGCTRFIYNKMLGDKISHYNANGGMLKNTPAQYKEEFPWLRAIDSLALSNAQLNLERAYKDFFRDKSVGFPKFKSRKSNHFSYTTNNQKGTINIKGNSVKMLSLKVELKLSQTENLMASLSLRQYLRHQLINFLYLY